MTSFAYLLLKLLYLQVIDEFDQNVHFVEIDIEEDPEIAEAAGIMGTPCVQFFKNKEMIRLANLALIILFSLHHACNLFLCCYLFTYMQNELVI